ncbi:hypothetical protein ACLOJK_017424 [Asimina triloba]
MKGVVIEEKHYIPIVSEPSSFAAFDLCNGSPLSVILSLHNSLSIPHPSAATYRHFLATMELASTEFSMPSSRGRRPSFINGAAALGREMAGAKWWCLGKESHPSLPCQQLNGASASPAIEIEFWGLTTCCSMIGEALTTDVAEDGKMGSLSTFGSALFPSIVAIRPSKVEMGLLLRMGYGRI